MLKVHAEDLEHSDHLEKLLEVIDEVKEVQILQDGKPVAMLLSLSHYEHLKSNIEFLSNQYNKSHK